MHFVKKRILRLTLISIRSSNLNKYVTNKFYSCNYLVILL